MFSKTAATCPVCGATLGSFVRGEVCSFPCVECQWIFAWDGKGKQLPPVQMNPKKRDVCDCASCQARDERNRRKYI